MIWIVLFSVAMAQASTEKVLYTFTGGPDGGQPNAGVVFGPDGNLYGVTTLGGVYNQGTVFQLSFSNGNWTETVLYSFTGGADGGQPSGNVAFDFNGNLFGTALNSSQCGTVFELAPVGSEWIFSVLHTFTSGTDGCGPVGDLRQDGGYLYGTTVAGGKDDQGTAFTMNTYGLYETVYPFLGNKGRMPSGGINSWDYGVTFAGGYYHAGNVYELCGYLCLKVIHTFNPTAKAGSNPVGDLATTRVNGVRVMYGTTAIGGVEGHGAVYQLTENQDYPDHWGIRVLHSFSGPDGNSPQAGVILDGAGNLYGTTWLGGTNGRGTVFKLTPGAKNKWVYTQLYSFTGGQDGGTVASGLIQDSAGNLYGTTFQGGAYGQGVVYEVIP